MNKYSVLVIEPNDEEYKTHLSRLTTIGYDEKNITHFTSLIDTPAYPEYMPRIILTRLLVHGVENNEIIPSLHIKYPGVPIIVLAKSNEESPALRCLLQGAQDYLLLESIENSDLLKAMRCAYIRTDVVNDYRRLFDENPGAMYIYDMDTLDFLAVNNAALALYGYTREEFLSMKSTDIRPEEELQRYFEILRTTSTEKLYFDVGNIIHKDKNGRVFYVHVYSHYTIFNGHSARLVMAVDVDERVRLDEMNSLLNETIRKQKAQMDTILSGMTEAVWMCKADSLVITYINKASLDIFGYEPHELIGKSNTLLNSIHPEDKAEVLRKIEKLQRRGSKETMYYRLYSKSGELKHIRNEVALLKDPSGEEVIIGISIDITENRNYQIRIEEQLQQLREIATIQSHNIRGPVARILGLSQLIKPETMDSTNADIVRKLITATTQLDEAIKEITSRANQFEA
ncbi:MAG: PAS domain S-box protein [Bacteroidetes bacterium]|nr:PAS domain S-box protein [Bacteroidota bacterium]